MSPRKASRAMATAVVAGAAAIALVGALWFLLRESDEDPVAPYLLMPYSGESDLYSGYPEGLSLTVLSGISNFIVLVELRSEDQLAILDVLKSDSSAPLSDLVAILAYNDRSGARPAVGDRLLVFAHMEEERGTIEGLGEGWVFGPRSLEFQLTVHGDELVPLVGSRPEPVPSTLRELRAALREMRDPAEIASEMLASHGWALAGQASVDFAPRFSHRHPSDQEVLTASLAGGFDFRPYEGTRVFIVYFFEGVLAPGEDLRAVVLIDEETIVGAWVEGTDGATRRAFSVDDREAAIDFARGT